MRAASEIQTGAPVTNLPKLIFADHSNFMRFSLVETRFSLFSLAALAQLQFNRKVDALVFNTVSTPVRTLMY